MAYTRKCKLFDQYKSVKLPKEKEIEIILKYRENKDPNLLYMIIVNYIDMVESEIFKLYSTNEDISDLVQNGIIGVIEALNSTESNSDFELPALINYFIKTNIKKNKTDILDFFYYGYEFTDEINEEVDDNEIKDEEVYEKRDEDIKEILRKLETDLTDQEETVIKYRYLHDKKKTYMELSSELNVSYQRVQQIEKKALEKLKGVQKEIKQKKYIRSDLSRSHYKFEKIEF